MSIATCGHEVYEGISCSIYESENEWSFGTYCVDCLKLYHAEGVLVDNEAKKLCDELAQQKALLDEAIEVIEFYSKTENCVDEFSHGEIEPVWLNINDIEEIGYKSHKLNHYGKRARAFLEKLKK